MGFENVCDGDPSLAGHIDVNIDIRARIEDRCDAFIIIANKIRKLSDTFGLNGFKNERHCSDLTRTSTGVQTRSCTSAHAKQNSGEHRLPACSCRQLADDRLATSRPRNHRVVPKIFSASTLVFTDTISPSAGRAISSLTCISLSGPLVSQKVCRIRCGYRSKPTRYYHPGDSRLREHRASL